MRSLQQMLHQLFLSTNDIELNNIMSPFILLNSHFKLSVQSMTAIGQLCTTKMQNLNYKFISGLLFLNTCLKDVNHELYKFIRVF